MKDVLVAQPDDASEMWEHLTALEKFFGNVYHKKQQQASILKFFTAAPTPPTLPSSTETASAASFETRL